MSDTISFMIGDELKEFIEGIYFGLNEDVYHAIPALSSTGLKNVLVSPCDFYFNCPWLNPFYDEDAEDEDSKEWKVFGRASHARILEGKKAFEKQYCLEFIAPEGCLKTIPDLKRYCAENNIDTKGSSKFGKTEWVELVQRHNPNALIFDVEEAKYYRETGGKTQLSAKDMRRIETANAMIEFHPELKHSFVDGYPEVSVIWKENGLWFKARFDYLKPQAIIDLKSVTITRNREIDKVLHEACGGNKYHIQTKHYLNAFKKAIAFVSENKVISYNDNGPTSDFLEALENSPRQEFYHVWQKKGGAPIARGKRFNPTLRMLEIGQLSIDKAIELYRHYCEAFGQEFWVDCTPITDYEDSKFPVYSLEI